MINGTSRSVDTPPTVAPATTTGKATPTHVLKVAADGHRTGTLQARFSVSKRTSLRSNVPTTLTQAPSDVWSSLAGSPTARQ